MEMIATTMIPIQDGAECMIPMTSIHILNVVCVEEVEVRLPSFIRLLKWSHFCWCLWRWLQWLLFQCLMMWIIWYRLLQFLDSILHMWRRWMWANHRTRTNRRLLKWSLFCWCLWRWFRCFLRKKRIYSFKIYLYFKHMAYH